MMFKNNSYDELIGGYNYKAMRNTTIKKQLKTFKNIIRN